MDSLIDAELYRYSSVAIFVRTFAFEVYNCGWVTYQLGIVVLDMHSIQAAEIVANLFVYAAKIISFSICRRSVRVMSIRSY